MSNKYYKLSRRERKLTAPPELKFIKLTSLTLTTFLITFLSISILTPPQPSQAQDLLASLQTTNGTVSLSTSSTPINLSLTATSAGAVRTAVDEVKVTSSTTGYQLYLSTASSANALIRDGATPENTDSSTGINAYASSDLIPATSITSLTAPAALSNDTWGFALASPNSTAGSGSEDVVTNGFDGSYPTGDDSIATSKFAAVPTHGNDVLIAKRTTTATEVPTNVYYGIRATSAKPAGLYKNTIVYTAIGDGSATGLASVSPSRTNLIQGGETLTITTPSTLALSSISTTSITIGGATCTNPAATKASDNVSINITCTSPSLSTGWHAVTATITTTSNTTETYVVNPGIEYYLDEGQTEVATYMQDFTIADCAKLSTNNPVILQDKRDGNVYKVTKLVDGNCWMSDNLRLGSTIVDSGSIEINSETSDYAGTAFSITSDNVKTATNDNSWTGDSSDVDEIHIYARDTSETDANGNPYGNLYNWYTATAKSGTSDTESNVSVDSSICPKNWKLPPSTGNGSYINLFQISTANNGLDTPNNSGTNTEYTNAFQIAPYFFPLAGGWYSSKLNYLDTNGYYWTRTAYSAGTIGNAYSFYFNSSGNYSLQDYNTKYRGRSVRCLLSP